MNNRLIAYGCITTALLMFSDKTFAIDSVCNNFRANPVEIGINLESAFRGIARIVPCV